MERRLLFIRERGPLALEARTDSVQVKVVTAVVQRGRLAVHIAPIGARLSLLVEGGAIGTQESEVLDSDSGHFDADVEHLALGLCIGVVTAENLVSTGEPRGGHRVQTVRGVLDGCDGHGQKCCGRHGG